MKNIEYIIPLYLGLLIVRAWKSYTIKVEKISFLQYVKKLLGLNLDVLTRFLDLRLIGGKNYFFVNILTVVTYICMAYLLLYPFLLS
jgi:hypothetical protein